MAISIGQVYESLTVVSFSHINKFRRKCWLCLCQCGNKKIIDGGHLSSGAIISCGCLKRKFALKHGEAHNTKEYTAWQNMKARCYNPNNLDYKDYGGRGILVCDEWINSYQTFIENIGRAPSLVYSLDRINTNGNYCSSNCKWSTPKEQANNKRNNKKNNQYAN